MARPKLGTHKVPTDERILQAAEKAFGQRGFERATLADIAAEAGIRRPSLLYHFETKDVLYKAVIRRVFDALKQNLLKAMKPASFEEQVLLLSDAFLAFVQKRPSFAPLVLRDIIDGQGPSQEILATEIGPVLSLVEQWLTAEGQSKLGENFPVRAAIMQICVGAMLYSSSGPLQHPLWNGDGSTRELAAKIFLGGIKA